MLNQNCNLNKNKSKEKQKIISWNEYNEMLTIKQKKLELIDAKPVEDNFCKEEKKMIIEYNKKEMEIYTTRLKNVFENLEYSEEIFCEKNYGFIKLCDIFIKNIEHLKKNILEKQNFKKNTFMNEDLNKNGIKIDTKTEDKVNKIFGLKINIENQLTPTEKLKHFNLHKRSNQEKLKNIFYQSIDGQQIFLRHEDVLKIIKHYKEYDFLPDTIKFKVLGFTKKSKKGIFLAHIFEGKKIFFLKTFFDFKEQN
ncbi:hypothetical protein GVAV_003356 [Gurleya vavrai]